MMRVLGGLRLWAYSALYRRRAGAAHSLRGCVMNVREGLERINAAWWALVGGLALLFAGAVLVNSGDSSGVGAGVAVAAIAIGAHRVCRWIIRGFFPVQAG